MPTTLIVGDMPKTRALPEAYARVVISRSWGKCAWKCVRGDRDLARRLNGNPHDMEQALLDFGWLPEGATVLIDIRVRRSCVDAVERYANALGHALAWWADRKRINLVVQLPYDAAPTIDWAWKEWTRSLRKLSREQE